MFAAFVERGVPKEEADNSNKNTTMQKHLSHWFVCQSFLNSRGDTDNKNPYCKRIARKIRN